jgi:2-dehydro-3-deoxygalactonokinase
LIAVDWGSTNFRAYRISKDGAVIERCSSQGGILAIEEGCFAEALTRQVGDWLEAGETKILLSGMIGSRQGWVETEYLSCPVGLADLANAVVKVPMLNAAVLLIPGIRGMDSQGVSEVIRGEETEAMGMLDTCGGEGLVCMPGTHSKWINISNRAIVSFITCMTGDVFGALRNYTILSRIMTTDTTVDDEAFLRGVARSADSGGLLHHLFSVRTLSLMGELNEETSASYLSGLLIGHEVREAMPFGAHVHLVGDPQLCSLYGQAIRVCKGTFTVAEEDAAARGLAAVGRRLKWI